LADYFASKIDLLYKKRWEVVLFFKWMKQHLKIKSFWGTTLNAVNVQHLFQFTILNTVYSLNGKFYLKRSFLRGVLKIPFFQETNIRDKMRGINFSE